VTPALLELISQSSASCWQDRAAGRCESSLCSRGLFLFDFCWVVTVPSKPNWEGRSAASVGVREFVEATSFFANNVPQLRSADT